MEVRKTIIHKEVTEYEHRLLSWVQVPEYVALKRAIAITVGLITGLAVTPLGDLGMLRMTGLGALRIVDMVTTGPAIGDGPNMMHSLIGILESSQSALGNLSQARQQKTLHDAAKSIRTAMANANPNV